MPFRLAAVAVYRGALALLLLLAGRAALAAEVKPPEVLAEGDSERCWVAHVQQVGSSPNSLQSVVYYRILAQGDKWKEVARIPARVIALSTRGAEAGVLLEDGSWMLLYTDGGTITQAPLPNPARMVALAGARDGWWAVGVVPGGIGALPTTAPTRTAAPPKPGATTRSTVATRPASAPSATRLVLFSRSANDWTPVWQLPDDVPSAPAVSLEIVDDVPYVAALDDGTPLRVRHLSESRWVVDLERAGLPPLLHFKLVSDGSLPRLWVAGPSGPDLLYTFRPKTQATELPPITATAPWQRTLTIATGKMRMIGAVNGKLVQQDIRIGDAKPEESPYPLLLPQPSPLVQLQTVQSVIVSVALLVAIFGSVRQRPALRGLISRLGEIALAPHGRRLAAGLIDASPVILGVAVIWFRSRGALGLDRIEAAHTLALVVYVSASLFYVLYTTIIESLTGRSLGKVLLDLRVVGLDGRPAKTGALVTRNLLRLIDVGLYFLPVLMILVFPLRQRAGDVAAGTLVVKGESGRRDGAGRDDGDSIPNKQ